jgi:hypothetical protein
MTFTPLWPLVLAASTFSTGYGEWTPQAGGMAALTRDEERYVERVYPQVNGCIDQECRDKTVLAIAEIINLRRSLNAQFVGTAVFDALRRPCESLDSDIPGQLACFRMRHGLSFEEGMDLAGFRRAGITREGYSQLRIGLRMKEVEFILGGYGDELSYASSSGYSAATYRWASGRRIIIVSFSDDEVSGRSQSGLF